MVTPVLKKSKFDEFKAYLARLGFKFETRPHQAFLARGPELTVNLYNSGKVVLGGKDEILKREVEFFISKLSGEKITTGKSDKIKKDYSGIIRIGVDEVGKGDYFGPLVVGGALLDDKDEEFLKKNGVRDSKNMTDPAIVKMAEVIRSRLGKEKYDDVWITPKKYNQLFRQYGNMNKILGWGHARVIENLLEKNPSCALAISDKFGKPEYINDALMEKGKKVQMVQFPGGEKDIAVAAASILARDTFLKKMHDMGKKYGLKFPKGAVHVIDFAARFMEKYGESELEEVAKLHFRTTQKAKRKMGKR